jgi:hypothetical protein
LRPAFWRYVAAGIPPEMPPPTTMTSNTSIPILLAHVASLEERLACSKKKVNPRVRPDGLSWSLRKPSNKLPAALGRVSAPADPQLLILQGGRRV